LLVLENEYRRFAGDAADRSVNKLIGNRISNNYDALVSEAFD